MHTEIPTASSTDLTAALPALPTPRPTDCDACERPLEHHEVGLFEYRGVPVLGLCGSCLQEQRPG